MYQFEVKKAGIEFVISEPSAQSNNFKIKIKLKVDKKTKRAENADLSVDETDVVVPSFYLKLTRHTLNPVTHLSRNRAGVIE